MKETKTYTLSNGKILGYAEYGSEEGNPIFHFHGTGSSRLEGKLFHESGLRKNIRIIVIDRPGFGQSDYQPRTLLDWPDTVLIVAKHLNIKNFSVMGISGGGPHALVCAYKIPDRIQNCLVIGTPGPPEIGTKFFSRLLRLQGWLFKHIPFTYAQYMKMVSKASSDPERLKNFTRKYKNRYPPADAKAILEDQGEYLPLFSRAIKEGTRQSFKGTIQEMKIFSSSWGFKLEDISRYQKVILWHWEDDLTFKAVREMSDTIPNCITRFFPNEGHFSVFMKYIEDILDEIVVI
ncbi:MAG: alpha/beta hydrolase [Candidatus Hodarchaeota archaeon]